MGAAVRFAVPGRLDLRRRLGWRWALVLGLTAALASLPALVAALPVRSPAVDTEALLERVRDSDRVAFSGYGESRGDLVLPHVHALGDLPEVISGTTRLRAWWLGPERHRIDALSLVGENDVAVNGRETWTWNSADRTATVLRGDLDVRLPRGPDLLAPALGARLSRTANVVAGQLPARRVAGIDAAGLRLRPAEPKTTTVERVDLWADPRTGLVLRVELHARGVAGAALTSSLLDVDLSAPDPARTTFEPPAGASVTVVDAPDLAAAADRFAPYRLPQRLAGLPRRDDVGNLAQGVATYGDGFTSFTVVPLRGRTAWSLLDALPREPGTHEARVSTALLQGRVVRDHDPDRAYLLAGTVPQNVLQRALDELRASPPPRRFW